MSLTLEFEGTLARKRRFHIFNSWNSKEASHESFVFTNHGCDLNVTICPKVFFRVNGASVAEKSWLACATDAGVAADDAVLLCFACVETLCAGDR